MPATGLDSAEIRRHNLALLLGEIVRHGPRSRSALAETSGLTRGAVTGLTAMLIERGILRETAADAPSGRGRPRVSLELSAEHVGIVVGTLDADHAGAVVTTLAGDEVFRSSRRHGRPLGNPGAVLDVLAAVMDEALAAADGSGRDILDVTVVVWAPVGGEPAVVLADTDLEWGRVDVVGELAARVRHRASDGRPLPVALVGDTPMAALAEHAGCGFPDEMLYLKSDSGIGGAVISHGAPITGAHGLAGALGHLPVVPDGLVCQCGQRGCLVTVAGPDAVLDAAGLGGYAAEHGLAAAVDELTRRISADDAQAVAAWQRAADEIARALRILAFTTDPAVIVLGGYLAALVPDLQERFVAGVPTIVEAPGVQPRFVASAFGADAAVHGAVRTAALRLIEHPRLL